MKNPHARRGVRAGEQLNWNRPLASGTARLGLTSHSRGQGPVLVAAPKSNGARGARAGVYWTGNAAWFVSCGRRGRAPVLSAATWCAETWVCWAGVTLSGLAGTARALAAPSHRHAGYQPRLFPGS